MIGLVPLRSREGVVVAWAQIDAYDVESVGCYPWHLDGSGYPANGSRERLHRFLVEVPDGYVVDHLNRDKLDNRLSNLRIVTQQVNTQNTGGCSSSTSRYRGVYLDRRRNQWYVQVKHNGVKHYGGRFSTEIEAAAAATSLREQVFGVAATLPITRRQHELVVRDPTRRCVNGHLRTPENTYLHPRGQRICRICNRASAHRYEARRRWLRDAA